MGIGDRLKEERDRLGLNQTEFASRAGASKNSQYNYEKGERSPDAEYLAAVAAQGVDVLYVVTGKRTPSAAASISAADTELLRQFAQLSAEDQIHISRTINALAYMPAQKVVNGDR